MGLFPSISLLFWISPRPTLIVSYVYFVVRKKKKSTKIILLLSAGFGDGFLLRTRNRVNAPSDGYCCGARRSRQKTCEPIDFRVCNNKNKWQNTTFLHGYKTIIANPRDSTFFNIRCFMTHRPRKKPDPVSLVTILGISFSRNTFRLNHDNTWQ